MFNAIRQPIIIWLLVPMSVNGVVIGLLGTGLPFSFTALLGLLAGLWLGHATVTRLWRYDKERFEEMTDWVLLGFPLAGLIIGLVASDSLLRIFRGRRM